MYKVIKKDLLDLPVEIYNHIVENNLKCAQEFGSKSVPVEKYKNIVILDKLKYVDFYTWIIYGDMLYDMSEIHTNIKMAHLAECLISPNGKIIKNRYSAQEEDLDLDTGLVF